MKRINKKIGKNKNKRICLSIFAIIMLLFVPVSVYASETKSDGKSAVAQFYNTAPGTFDLILMDIMMPEMNGYETTKDIRNLPDRPDGKKIPIIAMTANAFAEDVQAALIAGMDAHVAKPIDMSILISVITKNIER